MCNEDIETIEHILFLCDYASTIWNDFKKLTGLTVSFKSIVTGIGLTSTEILMVTLVAYVIFKQWLLESFHNYRRVKYAGFLSIIPELKAKLSIYRHFNWNEIVTFCDNIFDKL